MEQNISLSPIIFQSLKNKVAAGLYGSVNDAANEILSHVLDDENIRNERIAKLNLKLQEGLNDIEGGNFSDAIEFIDELIATYSSPI